jgi:hypothetical protein
MINWTVWHFSSSYMRTNWVIFSIRINFELCSRCWNENARQQIPMRHLIIWTRIVSWRHVLTTPSGIVRYGTLLSGIMNCGDHFGGAPSNYPFQGFGYAPSLIRVCSPAYPSLLGVNDTHVGDARVCSLLLYQSVFDKAAVKDGRSRQNAALR